MSGGPRLRWLGVAWCAFVWCASAFAADTLTIGTTGVAAGSVARLPVYIRDVSGTNLGVDQTARIQSIRFRVVFTMPQLIDGCKTTQFPDCQISFVPGGVLANLTPTDQALSVGTTSMAVRFDYDRTTSPIPFTLDAEAPGNLIGHIEAKIVASASLGSEIEFAVDESPESTVLADGSVTEVVGNGLLVFGGTITVSECTTAPTAQNVSFTYSGTQTAGEPVQFQAVASEGYTLRECDTVTWHFAGQGTATGQSATFTFNSSGTFAVAMTVSNPSGSVTVTRQVPITSALCSPPPSSDRLSMSPTDGCGTQSNPCKTQTPITFTAVVFQYAFQDCDTVTWTFSDGVSRAGKSIIRTFSQAGSLGVTMTLSNTSGSSSISRAIVIGDGGVQPTCTAPPADKIDFTWSSNKCTSPNTTCPIGSSIQFSPSSSDYTFQSCDNFKWDFGDGSTSTQKFASHTFGATDKLTVALTVSNTSGSATVSKEFSFFAAQEPACDCVPTGPATWAPLTFADFSVAVANCQPIQYRWQFGDNTGTTISLVPFTGHFYTTPGTYQWTVTVTSTGIGCTVGGTIVIQDNDKRRAVRK